MSSKVQTSGTAAMNIFTATRLLSRIKALQG